MTKKSVLMCVGLLLANGNAMAWGVPSIFVYFGFGESSSSRPSGNSYPTPPGGPTENRGNRQVPLSSGDKMEAIHAVKLESKKWTMRDIEKLDNLLAQVMAAQQISNTHAAQQTLAKMHSLIFGTTVEYKVKVGDLKEIGELSKLRDVASTLKTDSEEVERSIYGSNRRGDLGNACHQYWSDVNDQYTKEWQASDPKTQRGR